MKLQKASGKKVQDLYTLLPYGISQIYYIYKITYESEILFSKVHFMSSLVGKSKFLVCKKYTFKIFIYCYGIMRLHNLKGKIK